MSTFDRLRALDVFRELPQRILELAAPDLVERRFAPTDVIWRQGTEATLFTFIVDGHVKITRSSPNGDDTIIGLFGPGDTLGHVSTYRGIDYPGTAIALSSVLVLELPQDRMFELMAQEPQLMRATVDDVTRRAHTLVDRIQELTAGHAEKRLAFMFVKFCESLHTPGDGELKIGLALSRRDLANLIHVREETAIRIMCRWETEKIVHTEPNGFVVQDLDRLRALAADE